jgi:hypothetical protein
MKNSTYAQSVFINCPFDNEYTPLFQTIIFTLLIFDFTPRSAFEEDDGGVRFEKIVRIISECQYGIHDISRTILDPETSLPRFNMPFELGLDLGCKYLTPTNSKHKQKNILILDKEKHRFRIYLSDISGQDVKAHEDDPELIIQAVRNWLRVAVEHLPSASFVKDEYAIFNTQISRICSDLNLDGDGHGFIDYCHIIKTWLEERRRSLSVA